MNDAELERQVFIEARRILYREAGALWVGTDVADTLDEIAGRAAEAAAEDLAAYAARDAAAHADPSYVLASYATFRAVLAHRVAAALVTHRPADPTRAFSIRAAARTISETAKVATGVEIHPAARIGRRFVVDHGAGTVVGEQVEIGDDCYLLQNVVLGGRSVGNSALGGRVRRRHPRIGHRVEIAGNVMVLGPVSVGDDCLLEAGARITADVPPNSRVRVMSVLQVTSVRACPSVREVALAADPGVGG